jgi:hypothetical protein
MATQPNRESTLVWRKSQISDAGNSCVEVAISTSSVLVRDSRDQLGARLAFGPGQWRLFVRRVKNGKMLPG